MRKGLLYQLHIYHCILGYEMLLLAQDHVLLGFLQHVEVRLVYLLVLLLWNDGEVIVHDVVYGLKDPVLYYFILRLSKEYEKPLEVSRVLESELVAEVLCLLPCLYGELGGVVEYEYGFL